MTKAKTTSKDFGYKRIQSQLRAIKRKPFVKIGILESDGDIKRGNATLAEIATYNEYGTRTIPERSFIRSTDKENMSRWFDKIVAGQKAIYDGTSTVKKVLTDIGIDAQKKIRSKILNMSTPPNAESTIKKKGFDNPLVDTGILVTKIKYKVEKA